MQIKAALGGDGLSTHEPPRTGRKRPSPLGKEEAVSRNGAAYVIVAHPEANRNRCLR